MANTEMGATDEWQTLSLSICISAFVAISQNEASSFFAEHWLKESPFAGAGLNLLGLSKSYKVNVAIVLFKMRPQKDWVM